MKHPILYTLLAGAAWVATAGNLLEVPKADRPPVLDGMITPEEWQDAVQVSGLQLSNDLGLAREATSFLLKWDEDYLYVAAECSDSAPESMDLKKPYNDCLELFLVAPGSPDTVHWLLYASGGSDLDFIDAEYGSGHRGEKGDVASAVKVHQKGWSVEARIPATSLYLDGFGGKYDYKVNLHRSFSDNGSARPDGRHPEFSSFSRVRGQYFKPRDFATMRLTVGDTAPVRIEKLDHRMLALTAPEEAEAWLTFPGQEAREIAGTNGRFEYTLPEACPGFTLRVALHGKTIFANDYQLRPAPAPDYEAIAARQAQTQGLGVGTVGSMTRVFPGKPFAGEVLPIQLSSARNERESVQLVLFAGKDAVDDIRITASELKNADGHTLLAAQWQWFRVGTAIADPVGYPTVAGPGEYPDPLYPWSTLKLDPMQVAVVWAELTTPVGAEPGEYNGSLTVSSAGNPDREIPVTLTVWDFEIPQKQSLRTAFCLWEREIYNLYFANTERTPAEFLKTIDDYAMMLVEHRVTPLIFKTPHLLPESVSKLITPQYLRQEDGSVEVHSEIFDRMVLNYLEHGATGFQVGPEVPHSDYGTISPDWIPMWKGIGDHYRKLGILDRAYAYPFDEPGNANRDLINRYTGLMKEAAPDLDILLTGSNVKFPSEKFDNIDVWVPASHWVNYRTKSDAQEKGKEVWWYPCSGPWYPYPNYHLDLEPGAWRIQSWASYKLNFDGILYWAAAFFNNQNPLRNNSYSTNGDGVLLYSMPDGAPTPSIRLKLIADSMEDYEYLLILQQAAEAAAARPDKAEAVRRAHELLKLKDIFQDMENYALALDDYNNFRRQAAVLIEELQAE